MDERGHSGRFARRHKQHACAFATFLSLEFVAPQGETPLVFALVLVRVLVGVVVVVGVRSGGNGYTRDRRAGRRASPLLPCGGRAPVPMSTLRGRMRVQIITIGAGWHADSIEVNIIAHGADLAELADVPESGRWTLHDTHAGRHAIVVVHRRTTVAVAVAVAVTALSMRMVVRMVAVVDVVVVMLVPAQRLLQLQRCGEAKAKQRKRAVLINRYAIAEQPNVRVDAIDNLAASTTYVVLSRGTQSTSVHERRQLRTGGRTSQRQQRHQQHSRGEP